MKTLVQASAPRADFYEPFLSVFPISGAAISTIGDFLGSETVSASDAQAARLDELQFDLGEGPCWDAMKTAGPILAADLRGYDRNRWPIFSEAIIADNVASVFAFPLQIGPLKIGAVDMYSTSPISLDENETRQASAMADVVGRHILRRAFAEVDASEVQQVTTSFSRRMVHQATGMVLAQLGISAEDARLVIQGHAFATSRSMMEVSRDLVEGRLNFSMAATGIEASE